MPAIWRAALRQTNVEAETDPARFADQAVPGHQTNKRFNQMKLLRTTRMRINAQMKER